MHTNLFSYFGTEREVYRKICDDLDKDSRKILWLQIGFGLCLIGALNDVLGLGKGLWFITAYFGVAALHIFIDQSNRNFLLHWLDYERVIRTERQS